MIAIHQTMQHVAKTRWCAKIGTAMVAGLAALGFATNAPGDHTEICDTSDLGDLVETTSGSLNLQVHFYSGECSDGGDAFPLDYAEDLLAAAESSLDAFRAFGFEDPYQSGLPDYKIVVDSDVYIGVAYASCVGMEPDYFCDVADEAILRAVILHEMFHNIQRDYLCDITSSCADDDTTIGGSFGKSVSEGPARYMQDLLFADLDQATFDLSFYDEVNNALLVPYTGLMDLSYKACLFWCYCGEQLGTTLSEPERGIDFQVAFWDELAAGGATGDAASIDALESTIAGAGGGSLNEVWLDYAIANYTKDYDVSGLDDPNRYRYADENQYGEGGWNSPYTVTVPSIPYTNEEDPNKIGEYAINYYDAVVDTSTCQAVGFRGLAYDTVGWAVIGINSSDEVVGISKGQGEEFGRSFIVSSTDPVVRIAAVVAGLETATEYEYWFDTGDIDITIFRPTSTWPAKPGAAGDQGRFLVRLFVEGPADLEPSGVGDRSVLGLQKEDFTVEVGTEAAEVLTASYVGGEYWLVVKAPIQTSDGSYDLRVSLCGSAVEAVSTDSVEHETVTINHMIVIDHSGSMGNPSGTTKLDAAQVAASLYIDAVSDHDRFGVVAFNGNEIPCDDDTDLLQSLGDATLANRQAAQDAVNGLTATGWTSIGGGLWRAQDELDLYSSSADLGVIVVKSDGKANEARWIFDTDVCDPAFDRLDAAGTVVNAIAFGPESDQTRMQDLASSLSGDFSYVDVTAGARSGIVSMTNDLADAFMDSLEGARGMQRRFFTSGTVTTTTEVNIPVSDGAPPGATFFFNVDNPDALLNVELENPLGDPVHPPQAVVYVTDTHTVFHLNGPLLPGFWHAQLTVADSAEYIAGVLARDQNGPELLVHFSQIGNGGLGEFPLGRFEQGCPVTILAVLTDSLGPILGADVLAIVTKPEGPNPCGPLPLYDDGKHGDGAADDGVYGNRFTQTAVGTPGGVINDPQGEPETPGINGSYPVTVLATGLSNSDVPFSRSRNSTFTVFADPMADSDEDGLPDTWEVYYHSPPMLPNAIGDPDHDGLTNIMEFGRGTDPFDPDSDNDGELDGSEVNHGRCPTDRRDSLLKYPLDVEVITDLGDEDDQVPTDANLLRFPWRSVYQEMRILRAVGEPVGFVLHATVAPTPADPVPVNYVDADVEPGTTYHYRFQAVGADGGLTRQSRRVSRTMPPLGDLDGDGDVDLTDLARLLAAYGTCVGDPDYNPAADLDGSGCVDLPDLAILLSHYGEGA